MADYLVTDTELTDVANAIRTKAGLSETLEFPSEFVSAIANIPTGGTLQSKSVTPTESAQTVMPDSGYDGLSQVYVARIPTNYIVPQGTKSITENGTGIDVASYESVDVNVPTGGGSVSVDEKDVNFYDYDGTCVASYTAAEFLNLSALPENPNHEGLTAQGWNWTLEDAQAKVSESGHCDLGQNYITSDEKTKLDIIFDKLLSPVYLGIAVNGTASIDWGDGTAEETITGTSVSSQKRIPHNYAEEGNYTIAITVINGTIGFYGTSSYYVLSKNSAQANDNRAYANCLERVWLGKNITQIGNYAFYSCNALKTITIPRSITYIGSNAFFNCYCLRSIVFPPDFSIISTQAMYACYSLEKVIMNKRRITFNGGSVFMTCQSLEKIDIPSGTVTLGENAYYGCSNLKWVCLPNTLQQIWSGAFRYCISLSEIELPSSLTSISANAFADCYGLRRIRFNATTPPTIGNSNAFSGLSTDCIISVPIGSLSAYTTASNYPSSATYTYIEE